MLRNILLLIPFFGSVSFANEDTGISDMTIICDAPTEVYHASNIPGNPYFLNYGGAYPNTYLTIVIWENDIPNLEINPYTYFSTGNFCIAGEVETHNRRDQITLRKPSQIILKNDYDKSTETKP